MRLRRLLLVVVAALGVLAAWFVFQPAERPAVREPSAENAPSAAPGSTPTDAPPPAPLAATSAPPAAVLASEATPKPGVAGSTTRKPAVPAAARPDPRTLDGAMTELGKVHRMIVDYHTLMGANPVGTNAEIMQALMGGNPHQATLGPPEGQGLNQRGELIDPWGTPYFFHQLSGDVMEIHSAGPDKIMGTADDLVLK